MHQPYYKDDLTGTYILPWVRMHGIKDYYDMPAILKDFPDIHQTFNLVPSLLKQIQDYVENNATDKFLEVTLKPAAELEYEDKIFLLKNFSWPTGAPWSSPYARYWELLDRRGQSVSEKDLGNATRYFSARDYLDLQVWFNLTWVDPLFKQNDPLLKELLRKGSGFTEEEKALLVNKQREIMALIIPEYRRLADMGADRAHHHALLPSYPAVAVRYGPGEDRDA